MHKKSLSNNNRENLAKRRTTKGREPNKGRNSKRVKGRSCRRGGRNSTNSRLDKSNLNNKSIVYFHYPTHCQFVTHLSTDEI